MVFFFQPKLFFPKFVSRNHLSGINFFWVNRKVHVCVCVWGGGLKSTSPSPCAAPASPCQPFFLDHVTVAPPPRYIHVRIAHLLVSKNKFVFVISSKLFRKTRNNLFPLKTSALSRYSPLLEIEKLKLAQKLKRH